MPVNAEFQIFPRIVFGVPVGAVNSLPDFSTESLEMRHKIRQHERKRDVDDVRNYYEQMCDVHLMHVNHEIIIEWIEGPPVNAGQDFDELMFSEIDDNDCDNRQEVINPDANQIHFEKIETNPSHSQKVNQTFLLLAVIKLAGNLKQLLSDVENISSISDDHKMLQSCLAQMQYRSNGTKPFHAP